MKILLSGTIQSFADKKSAAVLEVARRTKDGPVNEAYYLKFHSDEAYHAFKTRYQAGESVQVVGLLRQIQTPVLDRETRAALVGASGKDLRNTLFALEVREHRKAVRDEFDTLYAHGMVTMVRKEELRQSLGGVSYFKARVVYDHFKRPDEAEGQGDFYTMVAFGGQAESLNNLEQGDRILLDYAVPSLNAYESRELTHSDGTPVTRNHPELLLREFSYMPRTRQAVEGLAPLEGEEIPF